MKYCVVTFYPGEQRIVVSKGTDILTAAIKAKIFLPSSCGGKGICGRCKVKILRGKIETEPTGKLTEQEKRQKIFLACRTFVEGNIDVELIPSTSIKYAFPHQIYEKGREFKILKMPLTEIFGFSPLVKKYFLRLQPPSALDSISDVERIFRGLQRYGINRPIMNLSTMRKIPLLLRESHWEITVSILNEEGNKRISIIEPGDTSKRNFGIAVDIGTTTISASLINLNDGNIMRTEVAYNKQGVYGEDVITRIIHAEKKQGLEQLHHMVVDTINELIQNLCVNCSVNLNEITCITCSGNTTMTHLLLKINPAFLRKEPCIPCANFFPAFEAAEVGIKINPSGVLGIVPCVSSYVGGDITAGVLVTGIYKAEKPQMLIDIGTNGEIVVGNKDWMLCCSASAGPAFEGTGVKCGTRAIPGAIQTFEINSGNPVVGTIENEQPEGICGSGYVEIIAELFENNIIDRSGRFLATNNRIQEGEDGPEYIVAEKGVNNEEKIVITQADIENLIRAKAAIFSGVTTLLKKAGLMMQDIDRIYIAGGFGNYLNIEKAITIGLLPDLPVEKFSFMGNTSLLGSIAFLLSVQARKIAQDIAAKMTYVDLSLENDYMAEYVAALFLPHTQTELFPTVRKK